MKHVKKWMVVPYVPISRQIASQKVDSNPEIDNELSKILKSGMNSDTKLKLYNQVLNKYSKQQHPIIPNTPDDVKVVQDSLLNKEDHEKDDDSSIDRELDLSYYHTPLHTQKKQPKTVTFTSEANASTPNVDQYKNIFEKVLMNTINKYVSQSSKKSPKRIKTSVTSFKRKPRGQADPVNNSITNDKDDQTLRTRSKHHKLKEENKQKRNNNLDLTRGLINTTLTEDEDQEDEININKSKNWTPYQNKNL